MLVKIKRKVMTEEGEPGKTFTGGSYNMGYTSYLIQTLDKEIELCRKYWTSSEFDFCPYLNEFKSCKNCPEEDKLQGYCDLELDFKILKESWDKLPIREEYEEINP